MVGGVGGVYVEEARVVGRGGSAVDAGAQPGRHGDRRTSSREVPDEEPGRSRRGHGQEGVYSYTLMASCSISSSRVWLTPRLPVRDARKADQKIDTQLMKTGRP